MATPLVLLLDADLLGLRPEHLHALLAPVARGEAEMTVGVFQGGRLSTDLAMRLTPFLSGQRALASEALRSVPGLAGARYDLELLLTRHAKAKLAGALPSPSRGEPGDEGGKAGPSQGLPPPVAHVLGDPALPPQGGLKRTSSTQASPAR